MFEPPAQLLLGLFTGICFGFLLQKGRVTKYQVILGQLLLKDWTVVKIMATAVVVGAIGVYTLVTLGLARLDIWPFQPAGILVGAVLFGVGIALFGYCPGTGLAATAEGSRDAIFGVLGMLTAAALFVADYNDLEPQMLRLGDRGKLTIPQLLHVSPWIVITVLASAVVVGFALLERYERRKANAEPIGADPSRAALRESRQPGRAVDYPATDPDERRITTSKSRLPRRA